MVATKQTVSVEEVLRDWYGYERLSEVTGLNRHGLGVQLFRARKARQKRAEEGNTAPARPAELPEPDIIIAGTPLWKESTVLEWLQARVFDRSVQVKLDPEATIKNQAPVPLSEERRAELDSASIS